MTSVTVDRVGEVATFWLDSGRPTLSAALVFRQGMVDETFATSGWTHVLEHLALHGRGGGTLHVNGSVSLLHCQFDVHGPPEQVVRHLNEVCRWLAGPDLARLSQEQSVLKAEADVRGGNDVGEALIWRYGAQGPGLAGYPEPGLVRSSAEALSSLASEAFCAENAGLFLALRAEAAGAYAPWTTYERVDDDRAVLFAGSDATEDLLPHIADRMIGALSDIAEGRQPDDLLVTPATAGSRLRQIPTRPQVRGSARLSTTSPVGRRHSWRRRSRRSATSTRELWGRLPRPCGTPCRSESLERRTGRGRYPFPRCR